MANFRLNMNERAGHLDKFRFAPRNTSIEKMQSFQEWLPDLQKHIPQVKGMGFFGSRTTGTDRSSVPGSDLDVVAFFDNSEVVNKLFESGRPEDGVRAFHLQRALEGRIREAVTEKMQSLNLPINRSTTNKGPNETIFTNDISEVVTKLAINHFITFVDGKAIAKNPSPEADISAYEPIIWGLVSRFHLAIGSEVYQSRKFILDELQKLPNGEKYFKILMRYLQLIERRKVTKSRGSLPDFKHLPDTIDEARSFFMLQQANPQKRKKL